MHFDRAGKDSRNVSYEEVNTVTQNVVALIVCKNKYLRNMLIAGFR